MSRKRQTGTAVSLFPFLAVLICAMGALIFLLIVNTRRIRSEALARAQATSPSQAEAVVIAPRPIPPEPTSERLQPRAAAPVAPTDASDPNEPVRLHLSQLEQDLDKARRVAADEKKTSTVAGTDVEGKRRDAAAVAERVQLAENRIAADERTTAALKSRLQRIESAEGKLRRLLATAKARANGAPSKFAFVPYDGLTGTTRRPIFIECTQDGLRFLPEGVMVTAKDLVGFTPGFNPLLAGTTALTRYWDERDQKTNAKPPKPYVLLLVRPDGSVAFYAARRMLASVKEPLGYELLSLDFKLALPDAEPAATEACRQAVQHVLQQRSQLLASLASNARRGNGNSFTVGGPRENSNGFAPGAPDKRRVRFNPASGSFEVIEPSGVGRGSQSGEVARSRIEDRKLGGRGSRRAADGIAGSGSTVLRRASSGGGQSESSSIEDRGTQFRNTVDRETPESHRADRAPSGFPAAFRPSNNAPSSTDKPGTTDKGHGTRKLDTQHPPLNAQHSTLNSSKPSTLNSSSTLNPQGIQIRPALKADPKLLGQTSGGRPTTAGNPFGAGTATASRSNNRRAVERRLGRPARPSGIGFERDVALAIYANRIVVTGQRPIPVGKGESRRELVDAVLAAVDRHARGWGQPPDGFYWIPALAVRISPGGNQHYEQLRGTIEKLELPVRVDYRLESKPEPTRPFADPN